MLTLDPDNDISRLGSTAPPRSDGSMSHSFRGRASVAHKCGDSEARKSSDSGMYSHGDWEVVDFISRKEKKKNKKQKQKGVRETRKFVSNGKVTYAGHRRRFSKARSEEPARLPKR